MARVCSPAQTSTHRRRSRGSMTRALNGKSSSTFWGSPPASWGILHARDAARCDADRRADDAGHASLAVPVRTVGRQPTPQELTIHTGFAVMPRGLTTTGPRATAHTPGWI